MRGWCGWRTSTKETEWGIREKKMELKKEDKRYLPTVMRAKLIYKVPSLSLSHSLYWWMTACRRGMWGDEWMDRGEQREGGMTSVQSLFPANTLAAPCLLSPPSHTSLLLLRQQHHPACTRHCLGLVVMRRGVYVRVLIWDTRGCNPAQVNHLFFFLLNHYLSHPSSFLSLSVILHLFLHFLPVVSVSSSIFHLTFSHLSVLHSRSFHSWFIFAAVLLSTISTFTCSKDHTHTHSHAHTTHTHYDS